MLSKHSPLPGGGGVVNHDPDWERGAPIHTLGPIRNQWYIVPQ